MNNKRRKEIANTIEFIGTIRRTIDNLAIDVEVISVEERDCLESMPENLEGSERYERAEEACSNLEDAAGFIDEIQELLDSIQESLEAATA